MAAVDVAADQVLKLFHTGAYDVTYCVPPPTQVVVLCAAGILPPKR